MKSIRLLWVSLAAVSLGLGATFVACNGDSSQQDGGVDATSEAAADVGNGDAVSDTPITDAGPDCAALGDAGCRSCCTSIHPTGAATFGNALRSCICEPDKCLDACAPTCTGDAQPTSACGTCAQQVSSVKGDAGCQDQVGAACTADPDCVAFFACSLKCP